jgi:proline-specific peptidase
LTMPDGVRVWYKLAGREGAPVVAYLHGGPGYNAYVFEKSAGHLLEESLRVLYIDQRGCGRSGFEGPNEAYGMRKTVEDVERIRVAIGADRLGLIGHSFGGIVAAAYAHRFPKNVSGIVMVDTAPRVGRALAHQVQFLDGIANTAFPEKAAQIHTAVQAKETVFATLQKLYEVIGRVPLQRRMHYASTAKQAEMEALDSASAVMGCTSERIVPAYKGEGYLGDAPPDVATRLAVPSLLLAGRSSEVIGKENLEAAAQIWGAQLQWVDGAGHFVYFEKSREFADAVTRFFATALAAPVRFDAPKVDENEFPVAPEQAVDAAALRLLLRSAEQSKSDAVIVLKDGKLVAERYFSHPRSLIETMSVTKSFVSLAIGLLLNEGKIPSLDVPLSRYFPEFKVGPKAKVTLRHVLTHTSGIEHRSRAGVLEKQTDRLTYVRQLPIVDEPGSKFSYSNEAVALLSGVVASAANRPVDIYLNDKLFKPLGITEWQWGKDSKGNVTTFSGLALHARDMAKVGLMLAQGGRWHDRQIVPEKWVSESTSPARQDLSWSGFLWWIDSDGPWFVQTEASLKVFAGDAFASTAKLAPLAGRKFASPAAYWTEAGALLGPEEREAFVARVRDDRLPFATEAMRPLGFRADGWLGQYIVVYPGLGLVGVRQHREPEGGGDPEKENETNGFKEFSEQLRQLSPPPVERK